MRIYTKTGDAGQTGLFGGGRVVKDDVRIEACGSVDELNAAIGVALAAGARQLDGRDGLGGLDALLRDVQSQLFNIGAALTTPPGSKASTALPAFDPAWIDAMEREIDRVDEHLPTLRTFVLPGGSPTGAALHAARTICRRAERRVAPLLREGGLAPELFAYLNRLSDLLFVAARAANAAAGAPETLWKP
jgi:cob(I)alamin adenosyltransferase